MIMTDSGGAALTQEFADAATAAFVTYDLKLMYGGAEVADPVRRLSLSLGTCAATDDEGVAIGSALSARVDATLAGSTVAIGDELEVRVGVEVGGHFTYVTVAWVTVASARVDGDGSSIQAWGRTVSVLDDAPYPDEAGDYSVADVCAAIRQASGVAVSLGAFVSTARLVHVPDGASCRQALMSLARALGGLATDMPDGGVLVMPLPSSATVTANASTMRTVPALSLDDCAVEGITVRWDGGEFRYGTGAIAIDDGVGTQAAADVTWGNLNGRSYTPGTLTFAVVDPRVTVADAMGVGTSIMPCWGMQLTYDGGLFGTVGAPALARVGATDLISERIGEVEDAASEARRVADAINQHFFADTNGVHVTEAEGDPTTEHNILINSLGILLRKATYPLVSITQSAIAFYDGLGSAAANVVARFGTSGFQVGMEDESHLVGDYHSLQLIDKEGNVYFHVSDLRDSTGYATLTETFTGDGSTTAFTVSLYVSVSVSAVDSSDLTNTATVATRTYTFARPPALGATVTITYKTTSRSAKAYTLGLRQANFNIGVMSTAEGYNTVASDFYDHAEGNGTTSSGGSCHSEGRGTTASASYSHAEGYNSVASGNVSHAEGDTTSASGNAAHAENYYTTASGNFSHAEGQQTTASGTGSHAQNIGTVAASRAQTAIGRWNTSDNNDTYALIIGNGTNSSHKSNALTVKWNGDVSTTGDINAVGGEFSGTLKVSGTLKAASLNLTTPLQPSHGGTGSDAFGTILTMDISTAVSVPNGSWKALGGITLAEGDWIVSYNAYFASNATGRRGMLIHTTADTTSTNNLRQGGVEVMAVNGGNTMLNGCRVLHITASSQTWYLNVLQTSGAALNATGYVRAFRLT